MSTVVVTCAPYAPSLLVIFLLLPSRPRIYKTEHMGLDFLDLPTGVVERLAMVRLDERIAGYPIDRPRKTFVFWILRESGHRGLHTVAWEARHSVLLPTLQNVAKMGDAEWCRVMGQGGAAVDGLNNDGRTALTWAASNGHIETAQLLVQLGADVNKAEISGATGA